MLVAVGIVSIGKCAGDDRFTRCVGQRIRQARDEVGVIVGIRDGNLAGGLTCPIAVCIVGIGGGDAAFGDGNQTVQVVIGVGCRADFRIADRQRITALASAAVIGVGFDRGRIGLGQYIAAEVVRIGGRDSGTVRGIPGAGAVACVVIGIFGDCAALTN